MRAIILAGGKGARLAPYTAVLPKPLMPIGDMPILELLLRQLAHVEVDRATIAVGHLAALIEAYFGSEFAGVGIDYSVEPRPLGTAGPLALVEDLHESFLVMNGDLLTDLDFRGLVAAHRDASALATVGTFERKVRIDFGVLDVSSTDGLIHRYTEKPEFSFLVSMGIYVFEPSVLEYVPTDRPFDLPELITSLLEANERVCSFRHPGYWLDIGRPDDYERAQSDFDHMRHVLLPGGGDAIAP